MKERDPLRLGNLLAFFLALAPAICLAQPDSSSRPWWVSAGVGLGTPYEYTGGLSLNLGTGRGRLLQVALNRSEEFTLGATPSSANALSAGVGWTRFGRLGRATFVVGPAIVWGRDPFELNRTAPPYREPYVTGGLVANVQLLERFGVGVDLYSNVNPIQSVGGGRVTIVLSGKHRR